MYLSINIILIILLYQCSSIYTSRFGVDKPGVKDCILPFPGENDLRMPIPYVFDSESHSTFTPNSGNLTIKHNSYFKLVCTSGKFKSIIDENPTEITVQCIEGHSIKYKQYAYEYDYFECDDTQRLKAARRAFRKIFVPKTRKYNRIGKLDCVLKLAQAPIKIPLIFTFNKTVSTIIHPDRKGNVVVPYNDTFKMACVGSKFGYPTRYTNEILVRCLNKTFIEYKQKTFDFSKCRCTGIPKSTIKETNYTCQNMVNKIFDVGFQTKKAFLPVYKICYDKTHRNNVYSWYTVITPIYNKRQKVNKKPDFVIPTLYDNYNISSVYQNQTNTVTKILKSKKLADLIIKTNITANVRRFLEPGLLLTPSEFLYVFEQNSAYFYENTAPMWYEYSRGIWLDVERLFRRSMSRNIYKHVIVSGTFSTCFLPNKTENLHPFYLSLPASISVPEFIWRMDYNLDREAGIVFIILNNPYKEIDLNAYICESIPCPGGLKRRNTLSLKGFLYCCTKASFEAVYGRIDPIVYWDYTQVLEPDRLTGIL